MSAGGGSAEDPPAHDHPVRGGRDGVAPAARDPRLDRRHRLVYGLVLPLQSVLPAGKTARNVARHDLADPVALFGDHLAHPGDRHRRQSVSTVHALRLPGALPNHDTLDILLRPVAVLQRNDAAQLPVFARARRGVHLHVHLAPRRSDLLPVSHLLQPVRRRERGLRADLLSVRAQSDHNQLALLPAAAVRGPDRSVRVWDRVHGRVLSALSPEHLVETEEAVRSGSGNGWGEQCERLPDRGFRREHQGLKFTSSN
uniref:(northern house mosquito) hypothetical protein n=1 Tax=Culex pipiens TaxID=7175 RepID=A0A8D8CG15_CULPI